MGKFGKELIESMQQAVKHAASKKEAVKEIKPRRRTASEANLARRMGGASRLGKNFSHPNLDRCTICS
jgi:hypothetical protein